MKDHTCVTSRSNRTQADTPRAVSTNAAPASRIGPAPASKLLTKRLRTAGWRTRARRTSWPCVAGRRALHRERLERRPSHAMVSTAMSVFAVSHLAAAQTIHVCKLALCVLVPSFRFRDKTAVGANFHNLAALTHSLGHLRRSQSPAALHAVS
jgi:hypothetical protein